MLENSSSFSYLLPFLAASLVLALTPGSGVMYIIARSLSQGTKAGLASVAGVAIGNFGNALGASLGLAALFAASPVSFTIVKYIGAIYLIYLGVKSFRSDKDAAELSLSQEPASVVFKEGALVALLNPKTALFFAAFLPQFVSSEGSALLQSIGLAALFVGIAASTDALYAIAAGKVAPLLSNSGNVRRLGSYISGAVFVGLGIMSALAHR
jgi:threonine/homoserine/homoserine lactone efflux protein